MAGGKGRRRTGDLGREALPQGTGVCAHDEEGQGRGQRCGSPSRAGHSRLRAPPPRHPDSSAAGKQGTVYSHLPFSSQ